MDNNRFILSGTTTGIIGVGTIAAMAGMEREWAVRGERM